MRPPFRFTIYESPFQYKSITLYDREKLEDIIKECKEKNLWYTYSMGKEFEQELERSNTATNQETVKENNSDHGIDCEV